MHRMMQDRVFLPWHKTWTVEDELNLADLVEKNPFLTRLPYRFDTRFGPPVKAPWEARLSPELGVKQGGSK